MADSLVVTDRNSPAAIVQRFLRQPGAALPLAVVILAAAFALIAPLVAPDPSALNPLERMRSPSLVHWFGTDQYGRSVFDRTLHGARISLQVGMGVAFLVTVIGVAIGLVSGFIERVDGVLMRIMDAIMAIPTVLLAIAFMALFGAGIANAIIAITLPEIPRMARIVRGVTLSIRGRPYIEAAITNGARPVRLLWRHVLPVTVAPVLVQSTFVFASAIITEAVLSFLGAGAPPDVPSWGNIISEGRTLFQVAPWVIIAPGMCLSALVLSVNALGNAMRDHLDPKLKRQTQ